MSFGNTDDMSFLSLLEEASTSTPQWGTEYPRSYPPSEEIAQTHHWSPSSQTIQQVHYPQSQAVRNNGGVSNLPQQHYQAQCPEWFPVHQNPMTPTYPPYHQNVPTLELPHQQFGQNHYYGEASNPTFNSLNPRWKTAENQYPYGDTNNSIVQQELNNIKSSRQMSPVMHIKITQVPKLKSLKRLGKKKRHRTAFTTDQVLVLEKEFQKRPYVSREERAVLSKTLGISDRAIKVWFQNRRMKEKRVSAEEESDESDAPEFVFPVPCQQMEPVSSTSHDLEVIEKKLYEVDPSGIVTFDGEALNSLINVIEPHIPRNMELDEIVQPDLRATPSDERKSMCHVQETPKVQESSSVELISSESCTSRSPMYSYDPVSSPDNEYTDNNLIWIPPTSDTERQQLFNNHFC